MTEYVNKAELIKACNYTVRYEDDEETFGISEARIDLMPTIDIVHCGECKRWEYPVKIRELTGKTDHIGKCTQTKWLCGETGYCMYGERKSDD